MTDKPDNPPAEVLRAVARIDKRGVVTVTEFRPVRQRQEKPDGK